MNTIGSHSSLGDLISFNSSSEPAQTQVDARSVQNTINQVPTQIVSALAQGDSYYGIAPTTDSLLGNIGTSSALNVLSQINASRSGADQISPYGSGTDAASAAVADAQQAQQSSQASILASAAGLGVGINGGSANAIPSAYYSSKYSAIAATLAPSLTFSSSTSNSSGTTGVVLPTSA